MSGTSLTREALLALGLGSMCSVILGFTHSHIHQQGSGCHGRELWQDKTYFLQIGQAGNFN